VTVKFGTTVCSLQHGGTAHHHYRQRGEVRVLLIITFVVARRNITICCCRMLAGSLKLHRRERPAHGNQSVGHCRFLHSPLTQTCSPDGERSTAPLTLRSQYDRNPAQGNNIASVLLCDYGGSKHCHITRHNCRCVLD
jgi:hypothetical protein